MNAMSVVLVLHLAFMKSCCVKVMLTRFGCDAHYGCKL